MIETLRVEWISCIINNKCLPSSGHFLLQTSNMRIQPNDPSHFIWDSVKYFLEELIKNLLVNAATRVFVNTFSVSYVATWEQYRICHCLHCKDIMPANCFCAWFPCEINFSQFWTSGFSLVRVNHNTITTINIYYPFTKNYY